MPAAKSKKTTRRVARSVKVRAGFLSDLVLVQFRQGRIHLRGELARTLNAELRSAGVDHGTIVFADEEPAQARGYLSNTRQFLAVGLIDGALLVSKSALNARIAVAQICTTYRNFLGLDAGQVRWAVLKPAKVARTAA